MKGIGAVCTAMVMVLTGCVAQPAGEEAGQSPVAPAADASGAAHSDIEAASSADRPATEASQIFGRWFVDSVGSLAFPAPAIGIRAFITFDESGFLSHAAACGGGYPAFYTLEGDRLSIARREAVVYGKCEGAGGEQRERALTSALDTAVTWQVDGTRLTIVSADGTVTRLSRPTEPIPELGGEWIVRSIAGAPLGSDRPATVSFSRGFLSAVADCNHLSTTYDADGRGSLRVTGDMATTLIGCSPQDEAEDALLFGALSGVTGWRVERDGTLSLSGSEAMELRRP